MSALAPIDTLRRQIAETTTLNEDLAIHDAMAGYVAWAKQAQDAEKLNIATEAMVRAAIKAGEHLIEMEERGERAKPGDSDGNGRKPSVPTLADLKIKKAQSARWQTLARLPTKEQEERIEQAKAKAVAAVKGAPRKRGNGDDKAKSSPLKVSAWNKATDGQRQKFFTEIESTFLRSITDAQRRRIFAELTGQAPVARQNAGHRVSTQQLAKDIGATA